MNVKNNLLTESPQLKWGVTKDMILKQQEKPATARTHCRKRDSRTSHTSPLISTQRSSAHLEPVSTGVENDQSTTVTSHDTHWSTLIRHPINCHVSIRVLFVLSCCHHTGSESVVNRTFNPRYCRVMDMRFVTSIHMIDSDLHLNGFRRVKQKRFQTNGLIVRVAQGWNMGHVVTTTIKANPRKHIQDEL